MYTGNRQRRPARTPGSGCGPRKFAYARQGRTPITSVLACPSDYRGALGSRAVTGTPKPAPRSSAARAREYFDRHHLASERLLPWQQNAPFRRSLIRPTDHENS